TASAPNSTCPSENFTISLSGQTLGSGINYQWESSTTATGPWANITGATNFSYTASQTVNTWYRCVVICTNSSLSDISNVVAVSTLPNLAAGTYTIGASGNYATLVDAFNALSCGIAGPVVFNVLSGSGPFVGGIDIQTIINTSATNTVTFNGNGSIVNEGATNNFLSFDGTSHVTFNDFKFINTSPSTGMFGIMIRGGSEYLNITNNTINVGINTLFASGGIVVSGSPTSATTLGDNGSNITITGNEIIGGYYGITLVGQSSYLNCTGNNVSNNILSDFYLYGIFMNNVDSAMITGNDISRSTRSTLSTFYGIYMASSRNVKVLSNKIHDSGIGTYTAYPVYLSTSVNNLGQETEFINNLIYNIETTGTIYALYFLGTRDRLNFYHNTINIDPSTGGTGQRRGIFFSGDPNNHNVRNNIISIGGNSTGIKYCIYASTTSTSFTSNNNILFMNASAGTGNHIGYWTANRTTLADWRTFSSQDLASLDLDPLYVSPLNGFFMPSNPAVDNLGAPMGVLTDINGITRSTTTPDAGAYEFTPPQNDAGVTALIAPANGIAGSGLNNIQVEVTNFGMASLTAFNVSGYITNGTTITNFGPVAYTGSAIATSGTATVTLGSFNFAMDPYTLVAWPSSPNGQTDNQPLNDTLFTSICVPLSGNFTIGAGGNFADMESAIDRLNCAGVG
ncbi:MAG: hypothetical protein H0X62_17530, partial [Bacteroidetes bacterium]|nr:hypothetical protein [Bacteroidota bacterium]